MNTEDFVLTIVIILGIIIIVISAIFIRFGIKESEFKNKFENGYITIQEFCDHYKTDNQIPAACYNYFGVKPNGEECHLEGKIIQCNQKYISK